jgi:hypothetical protein
MKYGPILKKDKNVTEDDPEEYGDVYSLTSIKTDTRLFIAHHEGGRTTEDALELFLDVERKRDRDSPLPIFISDNWDPFEEGLLRTYGVLESPPYKGVGRKPLPVLVPPPDLKYAQLCKKRMRNQVVDAVQRVVFGKEDDVLKALNVNPAGRISTSYIERINLTIRNALARFIRKGVNCSKIFERHSLTIDFFQAWYNFVKPHDSLKLETPQGRKKWLQRTPAMAEGLTDHIWTLDELMTFRVPVQ